MLSDGRRLGQGEMDPGISAGQTLHVQGPTDDGHHSAMQRQALPVPCRSQVDRAQASAIVLDRDLQAVARRN